MSKFRGGLRAADVAITLAVIVLAIGAGLAAWLWGPYAPSAAAGDGRVVVVRAEGQPVLTVELGPDLEIERHDVSGPLGVTVVEIGPEGARILESPCRDKICIRPAPINNPGQTVVCLPNRVSVEIQAGREPPFDTVSY